MAMTAFIELKNYQLPSGNAAAAMAPFDFSLAEGDVCTIEAEIPDLGHQFIDALSLISVPIAGEYCFDGRFPSRQRYGEWLRCRRQIGYIGPLSALISNLSIRENLLLSRAYYENDLHLKLSAEATQLCNDGGLGGKLSTRPADLSLPDRRIAIAIRELTREVRLVVMDNPEDLIGNQMFRLLMTPLRRLNRQGVPLVIMSDGENPIAQIVTRRVTISGGRLLENPRATIGQVAVS